MKNNILIISVLSILIGTSCSEYIDINLSEGENNQLVVEGYITNDTMQHSVRLTRSVSYFYNQPAPTELGASVIISDNVGNSFVLTDDDNDGTYLTAPDVFGIPGRTYTLNIELKNGEKYTATDYMPIPNILDSVYYEHTNLQYDIDLGEYYYRFYTYFTEKPDTTDRYLVYYWFNDSLYNSKFWDILYAGDNNYIDGCEMFENIETFAINEDSIPEKPTVRIDLYTISPEHFKFVNELYIETAGNSTILQGPPANPPTNIINNDKSKNNGLGYFSARSRNSYSLQITDEKKGSK